MRLPPAPLRDLRLRQHPLENGPALAGADPQHPGNVLAVGKPRLRQVRQDRLLLVLRRHNRAGQVIAVSHFGQVSPGHHLPKPVVGCVLGDPQKGHHLIPGDGALAPDNVQHLVLAAHPDVVVQAQVPQGEIVQPALHQRRPHQLDRRVRS